MKDFVSSNSVCNQTRTKSDECDLSITSVITDRIGRNEVLSPINHDHFNFRKKNLFQIIFLKETFLE